MIKCIRMNNPSETVTVKNGSEWGVCRCHGRFWNYH